MVEHNLAKVGVASSNLVSRSLAYLGGVAKWLRRRSAKPLFIGSTPIAASVNKNCCRGGGIGRRKGLKIPRIFYIRAGSTPALGTLMGIEEAINKVEHRKRRLFIYGTLFYFIRAISSVG